MSNLSRFTAAVTAAALAGTMLTGCADTSYAISYNSGTTVNAGVYIFNSMSEMQYQMYMLYYQKGIQSDYFKQKIDGKDFATYIADEALTATKEYAAVVEQCKKLKITLTTAENKDINSSLSDTWENQSELYEKEGVSKDSVKLVQKESKLRSKLFDYFYDKGGKEEVTDSDATKYLEDNYVRYKAITIAKATDSSSSSTSSTDSSSSSSSSSSSESAKEKNAANEKLRDKYLKKASGVSFDDFDKIIDEYNKETNSSSSSATDSSSSSTSSSEASSNSSSSSSSGSSSDTSSVSDSDSSASSSSTDTSSVSDSTVSSETSSTSTADSSSSSNPYPNETMTNYGTMDSSAKSTDNGKLLTKVNGLKTDTATAYEDDSSYYIIIKGDVSKRASEYATDNHADLLQEMKGDEFKKKIEAWEKELKIVVNNKSIKRYTPKAIYDIQTDYYNEKNGTTTTTT